jgi:hypothetical protein
MLAGYLKMYQERGGDQFRPDSMRFSCERCWVPFLEIKFVTLDPTMKSQMEAFKTAVVFEHSKTPDLEDITLSALRVELR